MNVLNMYSHNLHIKYYTNILYIVQSFRMVRYNRTECYVKFSMNLSTIKASARILQVKAMSSLAYELPVQRDWLLFPTGEDDVITLYKQSFATIWSKSYAYDTNHVHIQRILVPEVVHAWLQCIEGFLTELPWTGDKSLRGVWYCRTEQGGCKHGCVPL